MSKRSGYRGYIGSRPLRGTSYPQRLQNLVVRDYALSRSLSYKLSATEYAMPGCYMILEDVLAELPKLDGVILFSAFLLPRRRTRRLAIYEHVLRTGATLHTALEQLVIRTGTDVGRFEDLLAVAHALAAAPLRGRYEKTGGPVSPTDALFIDALLAAGSSATLSIPIAPQSQDD